MNQLKYIILFTIFALSTTALVAQEVKQTPEIATDSTYKEKYGLRVGIDLSKIARTIIEEDYTGFMVEGDFRFYKNYYLAAEIGNEKLPFEGDNIKVSSSGTFVKIGANYNAYDNWQGMQNIIFVGLRYGFTTFKQDLKEYRIYTTDNYFDDDLRTDAGETSGLTASWIELIAGLKVEVLKNLYLSANVQLKRRITDKKPDGFDNLTIPGFGRTYDDSTFGVGYGYSISYLIPIFKKSK